MNTLPLSDKTKDDIYKLESEIKSLEEDLYNANHIEDRFNKQQMKFANKYQRKHLIKRK